MEKINYPKVARKNELYAHIFRGLDNISFSLPIWILFFNKDLGLSLSTAIILGSTRWIVSSICELPTGSWADRYGRLKLLRIGVLGAFITLVPFLFTSNLLILFASQILGGFFTAMSSGVLNPIVKDSFTKAKKSDQAYKRYLSTNNTILYSSRLVSGVLGALIYVKFPYGPYILDIFAGCLALFATIGLKEVWVKKSDAKSNYQQISEALKLTYKNAYLKSFFVIIILYTFVSESIWTALQPTFDFREINPAYFGIFFGIIAGASALGSYLYRHVPESYDGMKIRVYMTLGVVLGAILMQVDAVWAVVIFCVIMGLSFGWATVNASLTIQQHVAPHHQSTMLSFYSLLGTIFYSIGSLMVGVYVGLFDVQTLIYILLAQSVIAFVVVLSIARISIPNEKL